MTTFLYEGLLCVHTNQECDEFLYLSSQKEPVAYFLHDAINRKQVSVQYWITDVQVTRAQAQEEFLKKVLGFADCRFGAHYSDPIGYLWTDEECNIGGHNLIEELKSHAGKWLILEIEVHDIK